MAGGQVIGDGNLTVRTSPPGAELVLDGETSISAVTPAVFRYPLIGEYRLTVKKHGFEQYETRLVLDPSQPTQLDIELTPRTGLRAAIRSIVLPGWGQYYGERKTKGFAFGVLFLGAATALLVTHDDFESKEDDYLARLADYDRAAASGSTYAELQRLHGLMADAQEEAYDAENARRVAAGLTVGIWALNVVDALLFTPRDRATYSVKGISIEPSANSGTVGLTLTKAF